MGSPGSDGNTTSVRMPATQYVADIRAVEQELIYERIPGKRNWEEVLRAIFTEEYADHPELLGHMDQMVAASMKRIEKGYMPICVVKRYHENLAFHQRALHR